MGGAIALEMARRLRASGRTIDEVALVDAYVGLPYSRLMTPERVLAEFAMDLSVPLHPSEISGMPEEEVLALIGQRIPDETADLDHGRLQTLFRVHRANVLALAAWEPKPYPGTVSLYHISAYDPEARAVWVGLAGVLKSIAIEGDHTSIVSSPELISGLRRGGAT